MIRSLLLGLVVALVAVTSLIAGASAMAVEQPRYSVTLQDGPFEVRDYPPLLAAETTVVGGRSGAVNEGFRTLARYIFGANRSRREIAMTAPVIQARAARGESIAMTAPVIQTPAEGDAYNVQFLMPSAYTAATLPEPTDAAIRIVEIPARRLAVIRFTGLWTESSLHREEEALRAAIARHGLAIADGETPSYAFYDPPWTPFFLRRNEVMVRLATP
jgi:hypothetical protein